MAQHSGDASPSSFPAVKVDGPAEHSRCCAVCQHMNCDVQLFGCGCLLHTTCLPLDILFVKQPVCPCCRQSPVNKICLLPLPISILDETAALREKSHGALSIHGEGAPLACGKRDFASMSVSSGQSYRTGRWAAEESAYTDKLIKSFDAGLLPLPHGIKLNDFLCDLLCCRTSRLTKKLKNAKLSARSYRSWACGNMMGSDLKQIFSMNYVGVDIQRAQSLFLKTISPDWVRMELQFNMIRHWRTHFSNFCLQVNCLQLDTNEWFASLDAVDHISLSNCETKLQERRKRMKSALTEDANAATARTVQSLHQRSISGSTNETIAVEVSCSSGDNEGIFVAGFPVKRLSSLNLEGMAEDETRKDGAALKINTDFDHNEQADALRRSISRESDAKLTSTRKFSFESSRKFSFDSSVLDQSMKNSPSLSSFVELFTPEMRAAKPPSRTTSSIDLCGTENRKNEEFDSSLGLSLEADTIINEAVDSVRESPNNDKEFQGLFLKEISKFLTDSDSEYRHVDLWVPVTQSSDIAVQHHIGGASAIATSSSDKVTGIIYGSQEVPPVRLSNAGHITAGSARQEVNHLNEFGMYSRSFSFAPGFGLPGRAYLLRIPSWENNLSQLTPQQFARVGGAKIYGVNTCLCIPVSTSVGIMVVGLYSTKNLSRDMAWERKCMEQFQRLNPTPKWKLTIDVGIEQLANVEMPGLQALASLPRITSATSQAAIIPPSPATTKSTLQPEKPSSTSNLKSDVPDDAPSTAPRCWNQKSLALLLGKYMPLDHDSSLDEQQVAKSLVSLRLFLLRSRCSNVESKMIDIIMGKYQSYAEANQKEHDLVLSLVNDWKRLETLSSCIREAASQTRGSSFDAGSGRRSSFDAVVQARRSTVDGPLPNSSTFNTFGITPSSNSPRLSGLQALQMSPIQNNNVPRVVSQHGPIESNANEED